MTRAIRALLYSVVLAIGLAPLGSCLVVTTARVAGDVAEGAVRATGEVAEGAVNATGAVAGAVIPGGGEEEVDDKER
ncbi:MAG: hypothetical protein AAGJ32_06505 [Pseudomonadota bacterium]